MDERFEQLLQGVGRIAPPAELARSALVTDYEAYYEAVMADPAGYWGRVAREEVDWFRPFDRVVEGDGPGARWFLRTDQHLPQRPGPARRRSPPEQGGSDLAWGGRGGAHLHLPDAPP